MFTNNSKLVNLYKYSNYRITTYFRKMKTEVIEKLAALITGAFGLVAALAWNEAIKAMFKEGGLLYFLASGGPWIYAIFVTIIAVFAAIWIGNMAEKAKAKDVADAEKNK